MQNLQIFISIVIVIIIMVICLLRKYYERMIGRYQNYTYLNGFSYNTQIKMKSSNPKKSKPLEHIISDLKKKLIKDKPQPLSQHLNQIIHTNQQTSIFNLLKDWQVQLKQTTLPILFLKFKKGLSYQPQQLQHFLHSEVLSSRVYISFKQIINKLKNQSFHQPENQPYLKLCQYLKENRLQIAYHRYLFQIQTTFRSKNSYFYSSSYEEDMEKVKNKDHLQRLESWCGEGQGQCQDMVAALSFLKMIKIIDNYSSQSQHNIFIYNLQRISKSQQKEMYIDNISLPYYSPLSNSNSISNHNSLNIDIDHSTTIKKILPNYHFYSKYHDNHIRLQQKYQDYTYLQNRHDYIQWMFPNHFGSAFNSQAAPLNYLEKYIFLKDRHIGLNIMISIWIFFDFMGLQVKYSNDETFELKIVSQKRLKDVILVHHHNHLRLMRILACLSVIGFRALALSLIDLLDHITNESNRNNYKFNFSEQRNQFLKKWKIYGNINGFQTQKAKSMCFLQSNSFPQTHLLLKQYFATEQQSIWSESIEQSEEDQEDHDENHNKMLIEQQLNRKQQQFQYIFTNVLEEVPLQQQAKLKQGIYVQGGDRESNNDKVDRIVNNTNQPEKIEEEQKVIPKVDQFNHQNKQQKGENVIKQQTIQQLGNPTQNQKQ